MREYDRIRRKEERREGNEAADIERHGVRREEANYGPGEISGCHGRDDTVERLDFKNRCVLTQRRTRPSAKRD